MMISIPRSYLSSLEAESIGILREALASFDRPVILYSIGKDSSVLLHLDRKAFFPDRVPLPVLHVDTGWKFREMIASRDGAAAELGLDFRVSATAAKCAGGNRGTASTVAVSESAGAGEFAFGNWRVSRVGRIDSTGWRPSRLGAPHGCLCRDLCGTWTTRAPAMPSSMTCTRSCDRVVYGTVRRWGSHGHGATNR
jgi:Phosphoadenosine phosphosulfate reductase family